MSDKVRYEMTDAVATITIDRPDVRNAMDLDVFAALRALGRRAGADPAVRAVVVTGEGSAFSSGIDTSVFAASLAGDAPDAGSLDIASLQQAYSVFEQIPKPTIAALHGPTFGGGLQLAIACDLRVAGEDAELCVMETKWGIIPDLGATQRLPRLIGMGRAKELCLTGRRVPAGEAKELGLVERVVPAGEDVKQAQAWGAELAAGPPLALAAIKRLVASAFDVPIGAGLEREAMVQRTILGSEDFSEAVRARLERRDPDYKNR